MKILSYEQIIFEEIQFFQVENINGCFKNNYKD